MSSLGLERMMMSLLRSSFADGTCKDRSTGLSFCYLLFFNAILAIFYLRVMQIDLFRILLLDHLGGRATLKHDERAVVV